MKVTPEQVLEAAAVHEKEMLSSGHALPFVWWRGVSIYIRMFPDDKRYRTQESGVCAAVACLWRRGLLERHPDERGKYRIAKQPGKGGA